jgi:hypothetical protein
MRLACWRQRRADANFTVFSSDGRFGHELGHAAVLIAFPVEQNDVRELRRIDPRLKS